MNERFSLVRLLLLLLCLGGVALGQGRVYREGNNWAEEVTGSIGTAKNLRIKVAFGSVHVQGSSQPGITYVFRNVAYTSSEEKARRQFDRYKLSSYVHGDTAYLVSEGSTASRCSGEFTVTVPREIEGVKIETDGGGVMVNGINGRLDAQTGGGSIKVDDIGGSVTAETGGDSIDIGSVKGDVNLETGGGRISIRSVTGRITASTGGGDIVILSGLQGAALETGGGNIQVKQCTGKVRVSTGGGNIDLGDVGGPVEMETGGGSIRLASAKGQVRAETGAGRIELNGVPSARAETGAGGIVAKFIAASDQRTDSLLETSAGDITVYIAPNVAISVRANIELANNHRIESDFAEIHVTSEGDWGARTVSAEGSLNGGGPVLKLRTTTGDIRILRASH